MNKSILMTGVILMSFILITSCSDNKGEDETTTTENEQVTEGAEGNALIEEMSNTDGTVDMNAPAPIGTESSPSAAGVKLNPAHGEPGHDCAVPVGEPLPAKGSAPSTAAPQNIQVQSGGQPQISAPAPAPTTISTQAAAPTKTAPGMNPPHGEPGHDCAIPVGEPLKK